MRLNLPLPGRALAIGAHPDDIEFGCAGTLAKWAAQGCAVYHLICTDGSKGSWDSHDDTAALVARRQGEQRAAARAVGGGEVVFLGWTDGELDAGLRQRREVAYWIRRLAPDVVLAHDPWRRYRLHPDHRNAGFLATDGIVAARDPHFFPEHDVAPHRPTTLLLWEAEEPDHFEDITTTVDVKLAALLTHRSQYRSTMAIDDPMHDDQVDRFRRRITERAATLGRQVGVGYAEAFKVLVDL